MARGDRRRVVLVRHGRSAHVDNVGWIDSAGVHRWREAYDAAGILDDSVPPPALIAQAASADCIVSSDLTRAIASAERLAPGRAARVSPLFREAPLEVPEWVRARWPLPVWAMCIHLHWIAGQLRGVSAPTEALNRATDAAAWLAELTRDTPNVVVVTHGVFRRLLGIRLVESGWTAERRTGGYRNWSAWSFHWNDRLSR